MTLPRSVKLLPQLPSMPKLLMRLPLSMHQLLPITSMKKPLVATKLLLQMPLTHTKHQVLPQTTILKLSRRLLLKLFLLMRLQQAEDPQEDSGDVPIEDLEGGVKRFLKK